MSINEQDILLLSAYIDDELTEDERVTLEARLQTEADLQEEFDALQQTVMLVRAMPTLRAPRDYTLDPAQFGGQRSNIIRFPVRVLTYAAAAVIVALFGVVLLSVGSGDDEAQSVMQNEAAQTDIAQAQQPQTTQEVAQTATLTPIPTMAVQGGAAAEPQSLPEPQQEESSQVAQGNVPAGEGGGATSNLETDGDVGQMIAETPLSADDRVQAGEDNGLPNRSDDEFEEFYRDGEGQFSDENGFAAGIQTESGDTAESIAPPAGALDQAAPIPPESGAETEGGREHSNAALDHVLLDNFLAWVRSLLAALADALR